ncbi:MAG: vWA domain-containing protein [Myxococcota bacterium]
MKKNVLIFLAVIVVGLVGLVIYKVASEAPARIAAANKSVQNEVTFGGGSGGGYGGGSSGASGGGSSSRAVIKEVARESAPRAPRPARAKAEASRGAELQPEPQTVEPTGQAFVNYGVNEMTATADDPLSTFAADVDTGSYTLARQALESGSWPSKDAVRVEEFVNYFDYDYASPESGPFDVHIDGAPSPFHPMQQRDLLRIGVQGKRLDMGARKPAHLTFLVDVSGSMASRAKIGMAKRSLKLLTDNLQDGDTVAIATYAGKTQKVLSPAGIDRRAEIKAKIDGLDAGGMTGMSDGLDMAYELAMEGFQDGHINRVIVLSDGDANVGATDEDALFEHISSYVDKGVTLSTIGLGMGGYREAPMEQLANRGNGNYYFIDDMSEARKVFGEQLDGTLQVIAKDVKLQVEFNTEAVSAYRLVGYENRAIADEDFRNDAVDAGEIGAGHTVTALYEVVTKDGASGALATVRIRHKAPDGDKASEAAFPVTAEMVAGDLESAPADFKFVAAVASFAEILRDSQYAELVDLELVRDLAQQGTRKGQADREEFLELVQLTRNAR